jgi:ubiquinone/menaquinone biosynthesis C-methylase UbiE
MKIFSSLLWFIKRKIYPGFKVGKNDLVVDIGSGDRPFWRADVFVDKLDMADDQRASNSKTISSLGVFVDADAGQTPFKDKAFDFSFCSHLLEHVENPEIVLNEIARISQRGYIEVPNGLAEMIKPFHGSHLWFMFFDNNNKLFFYRKGERLHDLLLLNSVYYEYLLGRVKDPFIRIYWNDKIDYEIIYETTKVFRYRNVGEAKISAGNLNKLNLLIIKLMRMIFYVDKRTKLENIYKSL